LSTSETTPNIENKNNRAERRVLCPKCEHLNALERDVCSRCGTRLYICCRHCGTKTDRAHPSCRGCGKPLPTSVWASIKSDFKRSLGKLRIEQIILLVLGIGLGFALIVYFIEMSSSVE